MSRRKPIQLSWELEKKAAHFGLEMQLRVFQLEMKEGKKIAV